MQKIKTIISGLLLIISLRITAQPVEQAIKIMVSPDHANWQYKQNEKAIFSVMVMRNGIAMKDVKVAYQVGPERMKPSKTDTVFLKDGRMEIDGGSMQEPGFLRCIVTTEFEGKQFKNLATAGFDIEKIQPTVTRPADFNAFWEKGKEELAKLPLDVKMTLLPERSSALSNVYQVNVQGYGGSRLYGILCVPKKEGKYPALLQVPGAGIRPYNPDLELADKSLIVFTIGIHGIPINLDASVYDNLNNGALKGYFFFNADNKDRFYYKRVYLNCVRANDLIASLPQFDGEHLAVSGGSQGGALSIVTAALDKRVKSFAAIHPALCDLTGYFQNRAGGWPHIFASTNTSWYNNSTEARETIPYYDVVNFAKNLTIDGYYTWGFNDETCPPTSMYAAYNVITAKKETSLFYDTGHWIYPEQKAKFNNWLLAKLKP